MKRVAPLCLLMLLVANWAPASSGRSLLQASTGPEGLWQQVLEHLKQLFTGGSSSDGTAPPADNSTTSGNSTGTPGNNTGAAAAHRTILQLVVLGDSYSDIGRLYAISNGQWPDPQWYWQGHYSNGPVWNEYLHYIAAGNTTIPSRKNSSSYPVPSADGTNVTLSNLTFQGPQFSSQPLQVVNFALGGSPGCEANKDYGRGFVVPWLDQQIDSYFAQLNGSAGGTPGTISGNVTVGAQPVTMLPPEQRAVVLEFGGNDYLNQLQNISAAGDLNLQLPTLPEEIAGCIKAGAQRLLDAGEVNLIIFTLPAVDRSPQVEALPFGMKRVMQWVQGQIEKFNTNVRQAATDLQGNYTNAIVHVYELGNAQTAAINNSVTWGFSNTSEACLQYGTPADKWLNVLPLIGKPLSGIADSLFGSNITGRCSDEEGHTWWDNVHPTTHLHRLLSLDIAAFMQQWGWR